MMTNEQKHLKEHFLDPETRCGFHIDAKRKELLKVQLDMLELIDTICKKHGLKYMLAFGSLLGAVRHKGIVPWDDDIDVVMPRPDYNKFRKVAPIELPEEYYLHTQYSDKYCGSMPIMDLRKHGTAAIEGVVYEHHLILDCSVFLDIFPIDRIPNSRIITKIRLKIAAVIEKVRGYKHEQRYGNLNGMSLWRRLAHKFIYAMSPSDNTLNSVYDLLFDRYANDKSLSTAVAPVMWRKAKKSCDLRWVYRPDAFDKVSYVPFEYLTVPIPTDYDYVLTINYGDWRTPVKGGQWHSFGIVDANLDYKDILIEKFGYTKDDFKDN